MQWIYVCGRWRLSFKTQITFMMKFHAWAILGLNCVFGDWNYLAAMALGSFKPGVSIFCCVSDGFPTSALQDTFGMHKRFWYENGFFLNHWLLLECAITSAPELTCVVCWHGPKLHRLPVWWTFTHEWFLWHHIFLSRLNEVEKRFTIHPGIGIGSGMSFSVSIYTCIDVLYWSVGSAPSITERGVHFLQYLRNHTLPSLKQNANVILEWFCVKISLFWKCWTPTTVAHIWLGLPLWML